MEEKTKRAVNIVINDLAESRYIADERCDRDIYEHFWESCIDDAIDDFRKDVKGYLETQDIEVNDKEANEIYFWALENVNPVTIRKYTEGV